MANNDRANPDYWQSRYAENQTGWNIGYPSTPIKEYIDQLTDRELRILIPGAGNGYEAEYLWQQGFSNITVLDIAAAPLENLAQRLPDMPPTTCVQGDFFNHQGQYDLILEQTFFCSFPPTEDNRKAYAKQMAELLKPGGKLVGLLFNIPLNAEGSRPFGGDEALYRKYFTPYFEVETMEAAHNSIGPRHGKELFINLKKLAS